MTIREWDFDVELKVARREAWEEAWGESRMDEKLRTARRMIAKNKLVDEIVEFTGLIVDDVLKLM